MGSKGSEFYNRSVKSSLEKNVVEMYTTQNEGKSVIAKRFIWTLKNKIYKYRNSVSKNDYIVKLDDIVNKYNNIYHSTIKIKPDYVKSNTYIDSSKEINNENPKFKIGEKLVILLEYQNIKIFLQKFTLQIGLKKVLVIKKVKNTVSWTYVVNNFKVEEIVGTFYKNELQRTN